MDNLQKSLTPFTLFSCGAVMLAIGLSITFSPAGFYASSDISLGSSASLISELRAPAGMLIVAGIFILASLRITSLRPQAWLVATLIYLSYGVARLIGFTIDGTPHVNILSAAAIEIFLGVISLAMLVRSTKVRGNQHNRKAAQLTY